MAELPYAKRCELTSVLMLRISTSIARDVNIGVCYKRGAASEYIATFQSMKKVKSGVLFMPGVPGPIQRQDHEKTVKTYGKVIHFWQVDRGDTLPLGIPQVMMALTRDGQLDQNLAQDVEKRFGASFDEEREKRAYMEGPAHGIHPLANAGGKGIRTLLREVHCKPIESVPRVFV
uniref:Uncharacterized protein n=1 Tax=Solanum demissum TaxID=50514 RepID=A0A191UMR3_SOLDE|nr:hypothetical protein [Solanum demissum]